MMTAGMGVLAVALTVAFPGENAQLPAVTNTYCIGAVSADARDLPLVVGGVTGAVYRTGAFLAMVPVKTGTNRMEIVLGTNRWCRTFTVARPVPERVTAVPPPPPRNPYADLGLPSNVVCRPPPVGRRPQDVFILVDPGHGGRDPGALSPHGWHEKDVNLAQARAIRDALRRAGFRVALTREDDSFPGLYDRPRRAVREGADAFISVHHNATHCSRDPRLSRHTVTYASDTNGLALATAIQKHVGGVLAPVKDIGAQLKSLAVCRNPAVPSCLVEVDFINLPEGEEASWDTARQQRVATAVTCGVLDWMMPR